MNKKLYTVFAIVAVLAFVATTAFGAGPDTVVKPKIDLDVCYVVKNGEATGARFGYMAEDIVGTPTTHQWMFPSSLTKPFAQPPVGQNSPQIWSKVYALPAKYHVVIWEVKIGTKTGFAFVVHDPDKWELKHNQCPASSAAPFVGYSIPYVILYTSKSLMNGYGVLVSTAPFASVGNIQAAFKLTAIPADLKELCVGPVAQKYEGDMVGYWDCDPLLVGILPYGGTGGRYPLMGTPSLKNIYLVLTGGAPWTATP